MQWHSGEVLICSSPGSGSARGFAQNRVSTDSPKFGLACAGKVVPTCWAIAYCRLLQWVVAACADDRWWHLWVHKFIPLLNQTLHVRDNLLFTAASLIPGTLSKCRQKYKDLWKNNLVFLPRNLLFLPTGYSWTCCSFCDLCWLRSPGCSPGKGCVS